MNIAVLGAGAMGCFYGGMLTKAGYPVWLIHHREEVARILNQRGVIIEQEYTETIPVRAASSTQQVGPVDLVIVFVKSPQTEQAAQDAQPLIGPDTAVLTLQNGLGNHVLLGDALGYSRILAGTSSYGVNLAGPGHVRLAGQGITNFGELERQPNFIGEGISPRLLEVSQALADAGLNPKISEDSLSLIWDKLMVNLGINALTALADIPNGDILQSPSLTRLLEMAVGEGMLVAAAEGMQLSPDPIGRTKDIALRTGANTSSMRADMLHNRQTEISMINGAIVKLARKHGLQAPVNETLTLLVQSLWEKNSRHI